MTGMQQLQTFPLRIYYYRIRPKAFVRIHLTVAKSVQHKFQCRSLGSVFVSVRMAADCNRDALTKGPFNSPQSVSLWGSR